MRDVPISEFKATCFDLVDKVHSTRRPLRITRRGLPVAIVVPSSRRRLKFVLGDMIGTAEIIGDIVSPVV